MSPSLVKVVEQSLIRVASAKLQYVYVVTSSVHALNLLEHGSHASRDRIYAFEFDATSDQMFALIQSSAQASRFYPALGHSAWHTGGLQHERSLRH